MHCSKPSRFPAVRSITAGCSGVSASLSASCSGADASPCYWAASLARPSATSWCFGSSYRNYFPCTGTRLKYGSRASLWWAVCSAGYSALDWRKNFAGVSSSTGDAFVFPILLGLIIGRIGCFTAGLDDGTYGLPTSLPWGIAFGDGISRHPTQLYEIAYAAVLWLILRKKQSSWSTQPGLLFKAMLCSYFLWRLWVDSLKPLPYDYGYGWSGIQLVCSVALLFYTPLFYSQWLKLKVTI